MGWQSQTDFRVADFFNESATLLVAVALNLFQGLTFSSPNRHKN